MCVKPLCTSWDCCAADLSSQWRGSGEQLRPTFLSDRTAGLIWRWCGCQLVVPQVQSAGGPTAGSNPAAPGDSTGAPARRHEWYKGSIRVYNYLQMRHPQKLNNKKRWRVTFRSKTVGFPGSCLAAFSTQNSALLWHSSWLTKSSAIFSTSSFCDAFNSTERYIKRQRKGDKKYIKKNIDRIRDHTQFQGNSNSVSDGLYIFT